MREDHTKMVSLNDTDKNTSTDKRWIFTIESSVAKDIITLRRYTTAKEAKTNKLNTYVFGSFSLYLAASKYFYFRFSKSQI